MSMVKNNIKLPEYSVLMSVYAGENPLFLRESIQSMIAQTYPTSDFVLVCDGPLTEELDSVIAEFENDYECFHTLRLKEKMGTGSCANAGIERCRCEYIVKMDSDDIACPDRCEISLSAMARHPEIDMLGGYIEEFDSDSGEIIAVKKTPLSHKQIKEYSKRRNPFNNQTLVYKKTAARKCGGYSEVKRCEDYEFVIKMLSSGARGRNIGRVLVRYRVTKGNYARRKNRANTRSFISVRWKMYRLGYSSLVDFLIPCAMQLVIFILPSKLTGLIYKKFLRG